MLFHRTAPIAALLFLICIASTSNAQWKQLGEVPMGWYSHGTYFLAEFNAPNTGFAFTIEDGSRPTNQLYRTSDGGITWTKVLSATVPNAWLCDIVFRDSLTGWVCALNEQSGIFKTTDGGVTWKSVVTNGQAMRLRYSPERKTMISINQFFISRDDAESFTRIDSLHGEACLFAQDESIVVFENGVNPNMNVSTDNGTTWNKRQSPATTWDPYFDKKRNTIFIMVKGVVDTDTLYASSNLGVTWHVRHLFAESMHKQIEGYGDCMVAIPFNQSKFFLSYDGGATWVDEPMPFELMKSSHWTSQRYQFNEFGLYLTTMEGDVWHWTPQASVTPVDANLAESPYTVRRSSPTTIDVSSKDASIASVQVFDLLGRLIASETNSNAEANMQLQVEQHSLVIVRIRNTNGAEFTARVW